MTCICQCRSSSFICHKVRQSYILRTAWPELPHFTGTSTPTLNMMSQTTSSRKLSQKKRWKFRLRRLLVELWEWFKRGSQNFTHLSGRGGAFCHTNFQVMTSPTVSSRLQNATEYCTKVHKTGLAGQSQIIWLQLNIESPNFARTSTPTYPKAKMDVHTPPTTSGRHLLKFKKSPKMLHPKSLDQISQERFKRGSQNFTPISGSQPHKPAWCDTTSCFRLAARCNKILHKITLPLFNIESLNFTPTSMLT